MNGWVTVTVGASAVTVTVGASAVTVTVACDASRVVAAAWAPLRGVLGVIGMIARLLEEAPLVGATARGVLVGTTARLLEEAPVAFGEGISKVRYGSLGAWVCLDASEDSEELDAGGM